MELVSPGLPYLPSYSDALRRGWAHDNLRLAAAAQEEIELRWQAGTTDLPAYCLGHIGYSVVPWKRSRGYATQALRLMLPMARERGLVHVDLTTDPDNVASQRVILANGGQIERRFHALDAFGNTEKLLLRIQLGSK